MWTICVCFDQKKYYIFLFDTYQFWKDYTKYSHIFLRKRRALVMILRWLPQIALILNTCKRIKIIPERLSIRSEIISIFIDETLNRFRKWNKNQLNINNYIPDCKLIQKNPYPGGKAKKITFLSL